MKQYLRPLWRNPGFSLTAIIVLALGIGANTAIFSVVRAVLLKPLPYRDADRIVVVAETNKRGVHIAVSGADAADWRAQATSFDSISTYSDETVSIVAGGEPERTNGAAVGAGWFDAMGGRPQIGRIFVPSEEKPNSERTALISDSLWRRRFDANPNVLGAKLTMQGAVYTVIGVMPPEFRFPGKTDLWISIGLFPDESARSAHNYSVIARLKPSVSPEQAQIEMSGIATRLAAAYPDSNRDIGAAVVPLARNITAESRPTLYLLLAAVGFVLLIACANAGNLLLAHGARRRNELAIRAALGAGRTRIVRLLLGESIALSLAGGMLGVLLAWWSQQALLRLAPAGIPRLGEANMDLAVLAFSLLISLATGVVFGLIPALQVSKTDLNDTLKQTGARAGMSSSGVGMRSLLVCTEIAFSVVLVTGAGLALRSLAQLQSVAPGYDSKNVLVLDMSVPADGHDAELHSVRTYEEFLRRAEHLPGVLAAGAVSSVPLSELGSSNGFFMRDEETQFNREQWAGFHTASAGYFRALSIPLREGRLFTDADQFDAPKVAVISESLARKYWPRGDALGHRITTGYDFDSKQMTIIGIVADVRHIGLEFAPRPEIYVPFPQHPGRARYLSVVVKSATGTAALIDPLRREFRRMAPDLPVDFTTLDEVATLSTGSPRFRTILLSVFAGLALALAVTGVYALMAYIATERTPEIGLRIALGATTREIVTLVLAKSLRLVAIGLAIGIAASFALARYIETMLYGVKPSDPATYAAVCAILAIAAIAATSIPALRASRVDPVTALRSE